MSPITLNLSLARSMASALGRALAQLGVPRDELPAALVSFTPNSWSDVSTTLGEAEALERVCDAFDVARLISDCSAHPAAERAQAVEVSPSKSHPLPWWRINGEVRP